MLMISHPCILDIPDFVRTLTKLRKLSGMLRLPLNFPIVLRRSYMEHLLGYSTHGVLKYQNFSLVKSMPLQDIIRV